MRLIKVGAAVLNQTPLAWRQNAANIREAIAQAKAAKVEHPLPAGIVHFRLRLRG